MTVIDEETQEMTQRIDAGEMKMVEVTMKLIVPSDISHDIITENINAGVSYIIDEHLFTTELQPEYDMELDDFPYEVEITDDVDLLEITVRDLKSKGKNND